MSGDILLAGGGSRNFAHDCCVPSCLLWMNWLAHLYLSEPDPAFRLGNLLPDLIPARSLTSLPAEFQKGVGQHRRIDAFTDSHPVVRRSIQRIEPSSRRFGGILCDIFYDHFLARDWASYSSQLLPEFARTIYASFDQYRASIPPRVLPGASVACFQFLMRKAGSSLRIIADYSPMSAAFRSIASSASLNAAGFCSIRQ